MNVRTPLRLAALAALATAAIAAPAGAVARGGGAKRADRALLRPQLLGPGERFLSSLRHPDPSRVGTRVPQTASSANGQLAFMSFRDGVSATYVMGADGSGAQRLTTTVNAAFEGEPSYSPDGKRIAYVCGNFEICVMNADGSRQARLTQTNWPSQWIYDDRPAWSPDGTEIAFESNRGGGSFHVWVVNADGSGLRRLPGASGVAGDGLAEDVNPAWSPDGTKIVFASDAATDDNHNLFVMNADGGGVTRLTSSEQASDLSPSWSPDGSKIVFRRWLGSGVHLYVMNADGSAQHALTQGPWDENHPVWSPDGTKIAFDSDLYGRLGIYLINADGSGQVQLTAADAAGSLFPAWQPLPAASSPPPSTPTAPSAPPSPASATDAPTVAPSAATADARLVASYYQWEIRVYVDFAGPAPNSAASLERALLQIRSDAGKGRHALTAIGPETARSGALRKTGLAAFAAVDAGGRELQLAIQGVVAHNSKATKSHAAAAKKLFLHAQDLFDAADLLTGGGPF